MTRFVPGLCPNYFTGATVPGFVPGDLNSPWKNIVEYKNWLTGFVNDPCQVVFLSTAAGPTYQRIPPANLGPAPNVFAPRKATPPDPPPSPIPEYDSDGDDMQLWDTVEEYNAWIAKYAEIPLPPKRQNRVVVISDDGAAKFQTREDGAWSGSDMVTWEPVTIDKSGMSMEQIILFAGLDSGFNGCIFPIIRTGLASPPFLIYAVTGEITTPLYVGQAVQRTQFRIEIHANTYADLKKYDERIMIALDASGRMVSRDAVFDDWGDGQTNQRVDKELSDRQIEGFSVELPPTSATLRRVRTIGLR